MQKLLMFAAVIVLGGYGVSQYIARIQPPAPSVAVATTQPAPAGMTPLGRTTVTLPEDGRGHFVAEPQINGARVQTLVDTG
ncbi:MAG: TIGR02281 family clan AA aspartic protease, partial [Alsobacter sp.]